MRRLLLTFLFLLPQSALAGPMDAVVRIPSHGVSATVIHTEQGRTFLLGCSHMFDPENGQDMLHKRMTFDMPSAPGWSPFRPGCQQIIWGRDPRHDLSLIEIRDGPRPFVCPVAGASFGHTQPGNYWSVGYDEMKFPAVVRPAHVLQRSDSLWVTMTQEPPWHGRSGGALIDPRTGLLVGVCGGYQGPGRFAVQGDPRGGPGVYTSHEAIGAFLQRMGWHSARYNLYGY